jgi:hypothetical protein
MGFSVADLFRAILLVLNALAILSERRFLAPRGLAVASHSEGGGNGSTSAHSFGGFGDFGSPTSPSGPQSGMKAQAAQLLSSVRMLLRWPLIIANGITILFALVFG